MYDLRCGALHGDTCCLGEIEPGVGLDGLEELFPELSFRTVAGQLQNY